MRAFFLSVLLASLAGALSVSLAGGSAYEKYIKYIVSLLLILVLIAPFASLKTIDYEFEAQETLSAAADGGAFDFELTVHSADAGARYTSSRSTRSFCGILTHFYRTT